MGPVVTTLLVLISLAILGGQAYKWLSKFQGGKIVYSCVGKRVEFPWEFTLEKGERVFVISWTFDGYFTSQQVASYTKGFNPYPAYTRRVTQVGNAGINLGNVTQNDNGNYTVEITGIDGSGNSFTFVGMAVLQVIDSPVPEGQELKVTQLQEAIKVKDTGKWSVALACGKFIHLDLPPFPVYWTTPTGEVIKESTDYKDGHYILLLSNPVKGGNYSCEVPTLYADEACVNAGSGRKTIASVAVDGLQARVAFLESHQEDIVRQNEELQRQSEELQRQSEELQRQSEELQRDNEELHRDNEKLAAAVQQLNSTSVVKETVAELNLRMTTFEDATSERIDVATRLVAFHARLSTSLTFSGSRQRLQGFNVIYNAGSAFNGATGEFTAPFSGTYYFIGSTGSRAKDKLSTMSLMKAGTEVSQAYVEQNGTYDSMGSCYATLHLETGENVWLQSFYDNTNHFHYETTSFSGFLLHADV